MNKNHDDLAHRVRQVASAIMPDNVAPGRDAMGGTVACLTEAVMGITAALSRIGGALEQIAEAIEGIHSRESSP